MLLPTRIVATAAVLALSIAPTALAASGPPANAGTAHMPTSSTAPTSGDATGAKPAEPGPAASLPAKAKAYGTYCKASSRKHVAGQKGTPFSQCVTAMAKLATAASSDSTTTPNPARACASASKKHVAGQKGTPFSQCVSAAAKLLQDKQDDGSDTTTDDGAGS
jgi:hypothetical protein